MRRCVKCGKTFLTRGRIKLADADICFKCFDELGFDHKIGIYTGSHYKWDDIKDGAKAPSSKQVYDFIVHSENEKTDRALEKYQKFWTDKEDQYDGMRLMEFKKTGDPGDKVYKYPPLDVRMRIQAFIGEDGTVEISGYIFNGEDDLIYVGKAAKTKAKKILRILQENKPKITGELYGGPYWKIEDSGYVNNDWEEAYKVRVHLTY